MVQHGKTVWLRLYFQLDYWTTFLFDINDFDIVVMFHQAMIVAQLRKNIWLVKLLHFHFYWFTLIISKLCLFQKSFISFQRFQTISFWHPFALVSQQSQLVSHHFVAIYSFYIFDFIFHWNDKNTKWVQLRTEVLQLMEVCKVNNM